MPPDARLAAFLAALRGRVDQALEGFLPSPPSCPAIIAEAMRYSVFAGGKRLRPVLALATADAVAPGDERAQARALPCACALELIHTYSLIHDDLPAMDDDTLRRGRATAHVVYGDGIAILAGDGLHAEAFALLAREPADDDPTIAARKLRTLQVVAAAAGPAGMVGGQAIDLQAAGRTTGERLVLDADTLRAMHARKTGALIRASALGGAIMAGTDEATIAAVGCYAEAIGLAFQIIDDILDVEGAAEQLGKTAGKDAAADKPTYPSLFGLEPSRVAAEACAARARQVLADAGLTRGWLGPIADWIVSRDR